MFWTKPCNFLMNIFFANSLYIYFMVQFDRVISRKKKQLNNKKVMILWNILQFLILLQKFSSNCECFIFLGTSILFYHNYWIIFMILNSITSFTNYQNDMKNFHIIFKIQFQVYKNENVVWKMSIKSKLRFWVVFNVENAPIF